MTGMSLLRVEIFNEVDGKDPVKLGELKVDLPSVREQGEDRKVIPFTQKIIPAGKITAEATFFPKNNRIKRAEVVHEKKRVHRGHRYEPNYFPQITKCAYCGEVLWGFLQAQGLKCQNCDRAVHNRCYDKDPVVCGASTVVEDKAKDFAANLNHK